MRRLNRLIGFVYYDVEDFRLFITKLMLLQLLGKNIIYPYVLLSCIFFLISHIINAQNIPDDRKNWDKTLINGTKIENNDTSGLSLYKIENLPLNTIQSEFAAKPFNNGILFVSKRTKSTRKPGENSVFSFFYAKEAGNSEYLSQRVKNQGNLTIHSGPFTIAKDGMDFIYFTRNATIVENDTTINRLAIYYIKYQKRRWVKARSFEFNSNIYSVGHPAISEDGKWLFFVSDMPGGYGGTDIYLCRKLGDTWSKPENLGGKINTPKDELFPFFHADGTLYFSSNGFKGFGGLDIYMSKFNDYTWELPLNLHSPINSDSDDFSFYCDSIKRTGYFSSNRAGGKGSDDIYSFVFDTTKLHSIKCVVTDQYDIPLENARINIQYKYLPKEVLYTNFSGSFYIKLEPGNIFFITIDKIGFKQKLIPSDTLKSGKQAGKAMRIKLVPD